MERRSPERVQGTNTKEQQYHGKQASRGTGGMACGVTILEGSVGVLSPHKP